jgi:hypothetical protein
MTRVICALVLLLSFCSISIALAQPAGWRRTARTEIMRWIKKSVAQLDRESRKEDLGPTSLNEEATIFRFSDLDADGDEDAIAEFTTEGLGSGSVLQYLAIFRNDDGRPRFARQIEPWSLGSQIMANSADGGYGEPRYYTLVAADRNILTFETLTATEDDGSCCPSIEATYAFSYDRKQLRFDRVVTAAHRVEQ